MDAANAVIFTARRYAKRATSGRLVSVTRPSVTLAYCMPND